MHRRTSGAVLDTEFESGELIGLGKTSLKNIVHHLKQVYCESIGVEYMYVRSPEQLKWIQSWLHRNNNHPEFDKSEKLQSSKVGSYLRRSLTGFVFVKRCPLER